jgi:hypothetical protein
MTSAADDDDARVSEAMRATSIGRIGSATALFAAAAAALARPTTRPRTAAAAAKAAAAPALPPTPTPPADMRRTLSLPVLVAQQAPAPSQQPPAAAAAAAAAALRGAVHPLQAPAAPPREAFRRGVAPSPSGQPHGHPQPLIVTGNPLARSQRLGVEKSADSAHQVPVNQAEAFPFETDTFAGRVWVFFKGLRLPDAATAAPPASTPPPPADLFGPGKKRLFHVVVQGTFRRRVRASSFCVGQEFLKPGNAPTWLGELVMAAAARSFSSSAVVEARRGGRASFMNPLLAASQRVNVSKRRRRGDGREEEEEEEEEQFEDLGDPWAAQEDLRLWAPELVAGGEGELVAGGEGEGEGEEAAPMPSEQRRRWCDCADNLAGRHFEADPDLVWTFHIYQHLVDFANYRLCLGGGGGGGGGGAGGGSPPASTASRGLWASLANIDLAPALDRQPLQLTLKDVDAEEYAMSLLCWHERLLYPDGNGAGG